MSSGQRAGEELRGRVQGPIPVRPVSLIRRAVEARRVGAVAAADLNEQRRTRREAGEVVDVGRLLVSRRALEAVAAEGGGVNGTAVVEVTDFLGERDVVRVRRPQHPGGR